MTLSDSTDQPLAQSNLAQVAPDADVSSETAEIRIADEAGTKTESTEVLGFRPQDRRVMIVLTSVLLLWLTIEWIVVATRRPNPLLLQRGPEFQAQFRVNVNESIWVDWIQLEGIGPSLAQRIVTDRNLNGPFSSIEDVTRVQGIGPATLDRIRPWLTMGHNANETRSANAVSQHPSDTQPATNKR